MPALSFEEILKYNHHHGADGRFASTDGAAAAAPSFIDPDTGEFDPFAAVMWGAEHPEELSQKPKENWEKPYQMAEGKDLTKGSREEQEEIADLLTEEILDIQGFNGRPKVAKSMEEFKEAVKQNGNIACRGISADSAEILDAYVDQLKNGEFNVRCTGGAQYGRGMYMATSWDGVTDYDAAYRVADNYSSRYGKRGAVINMTLDKSAKVVDFYELMQMARNDSGPFQNASNLSKIDDAGHDIGAYAAAKGYDAISVNNGQGYTIVLNRTKLTIFEQTGNVEHMDGGEDLLYGDWDMPAFLRGE